jgi:hypothetical protein
MTDKPGDHPPPHVGLDKQRPAMFKLLKGEVVFRHHQLIHDPLFFGMTGNSRFDAPDCPHSSFGVMYAGEDMQCCFIESCGSTTGSPTVSGAYLTDRQIAEIELVKDMEFIDLTASGGLSRIGADARLMTGSYTIAQQWSAALRKHPSKPDGIRYLSRHDPTRAAYAIYDCARSSFKITNRGSLMDASNRALLKEILNLYQVNLI